MAPRNSWWLFVLIPLGIFLLTCCDVNNSDEFKDTFSYQVSQQSVIETDTMQRPAGQDSSITVQTFSVEPGDSTVFRYEHNVIPPDNVLDAGFFETLVFQVSPNADRFELEEGDFDRAKAFYLRSCFCELPGAAFEVTSGTIRGERLSQVHWIIQADVVIESIVGKFKVKFNKPFYSN